MVGMWIVLAVVVLIAVGAFVATVIRRPRGDDLHSVRSYHSALGTLEHLSERTNRPTPDVAAPADPSSDSRLRPRFYSRAGAEGDAPPMGQGEDRGDPGHPSLPPGTDRSVPPVPVRGTEQFPDPGAALVFDDSRPRDHHRRSSAPDGGQVSRTDRAQRHALDSMNHRPRRGASLMIVVAALVLFGVLAYVGSRRSNPSIHHTSATSTTAHTARSTGTSATVSGSSPQGSSTTKPKGKTKSTATTAPSQIVALSSTSTTAVYPVGASSYRLTVTATGPCWVSATNPLTGSTLWTGTLQSGAVQQIQANSIVRLDLGAPSASLAVNGVPVVLPTPLHSPFAATFEPPSGTSTSGTTATSTTAGSTTTSTG
jgi:Domain of unknown function (DUF4115)